MLGIRRKLELQLTLPLPPFNVATLWKYAEHIIARGSFPLKTLECFKTFFEDCSYALHEECLQRNEHVYEIITDTCHYNSRLCTNLLFITRLYARCSSQVFRH